MENESRSALGPASTFPSRRDTPEHKSAFAQVYGGQQRLGVAAARRNAADQLRLKAKHERRGEVEAIKLDLSHIYRCDVQIRGKTAGFRQMMAENNLQPPRAE